MQNRSQLLTCPHITMDCEGRKCLRGASAWPEANVGAGSATGQGRCQPTVMYDELFLLSCLSCRTYFRYFKVDLWKPCPFGGDDGLCALRDCAVCECDQEEIPSCWKEEDAVLGKGGLESCQEQSHTSSSSSSGSSITSPSEEEEKVAQLSKVEVSEAPSEEGFVGWDIQGSGTLLSSNLTTNGNGNGDGNGGKQATASLSQRQAGKLSGKGGRGALSSAASNATLRRPDPWAGDSEQSSPHAQYISLLDNPEGYTGYSGPDALNIWRKIYEENCFHIGPALFSQPTPAPRPAGGKPGAAGSSVLSALAGSASTAAKKALQAILPQHQQEDEQLCKPEMVFYRIISGLQTSINSHIAMTYNEGRGLRGKDDLFYSSDMHSSSLLSELPRRVLQRVLEGTVNETAVQPAQQAESTPASAENGDASRTASSVESSSSIRAAAAAAAASLVQDLEEVKSLVLMEGLQPDLHMYVQRIAAFPERQENLYFTYLFVLRAVVKARPLLAQAVNFSTGHAEEDAMTRRLVLALTDIQAPAVLAGFNESLLMPAALMRDGDVAMEEAGGRAKQEQLQQETQQSVQPPVQYVPEVAAQQAQAAESCSARPSNASIEAPVAPLVAPAAASEQQLHSLLHQHVAESVAAAGAAAAAAAAASTKGGDSTSTPGSDAASGTPALAAAAVTADGQADVLSRLDPGLATQELQGKPLLLQLQRQGQSLHQMPIPLGSPLEDAWRDKYRNISRILDCVGCEKCRLWGKLQFLGLGTAMKIMFASAAAEAKQAMLQQHQQQQQQQQLGAPALGADSGSVGAGGVAAAAAVLPEIMPPVAALDISLSRNEVVALVNVLHRLSMSLAAIDIMEDMVAERPQLLEEKRLQQKQGLQKQKQKQQQPLPWG